jgi:hypothetical protein
VQALSSNSGTAKKKKKKKEKENPEDIYMYMKRFPPYIIPWKKVDLKRIL